MPRDIDHAGLLEAALRERAQLRLAWLRNPASTEQLGPAGARLLGPEGIERLEQALREHRYRAQELAELPGVFGDLAREQVMQEARRWLGGFLQKPVPLGSVARLPAVVLCSFSDPVNAAVGPTTALRGLDGALEPHAARLVELHERAEHEAQAQVARLSRLIPPPAPEREREPASTALAGGPAPAGPAAQPVVSPDQAMPAPTELERARLWLEETDDATRELSRWLRKRTELPGAQSELAKLCVGLRAVALDGLARPARRFFRVAEGARRLGFERELNTRMRGETAAALLIPLPASVAIAGSSDVRVLQPGLNYGVLSDLAVAQGLGEGLAAALISPVLGPVLGRPRGASVGAAVGGLFAQLRADAAYLRRVDGFDPEPAETAARHAALSLLLRARLAAALALAVAEPARSNADRVVQLSAAGERALGCPLSGGMSALWSLGAVASVGPQQQFAGLCWGLELHAGLRERLDEDFYLNPRTSDVLRGAAARGAELDAAGFAEELGRRGGGAASRALELLS